MSPANDILTEEDIRAKNEKRAVVDESKASYGNFEAYFCSEGCPFSCVVKTHFLYPAGHSIATDRKIYHNFYLTNACFSNFWGK